MTDAQEPNWPNAPKTLIDAWFVTVPILWVHFGLYALAMRLGSNAFGSIFPGFFVAHGAVMMSFSGLMVAQFSCLNVVSREVGLPRWEKVVWWVVVFLIPPLAVPGYYFMRMRGMLFDLGAPRLGLLPKFVGGFIQLFTDFAVLQFAFVPLIVALPLIGAHGETFDVSVWFAHPLFGIHCVFAFAGALWCLVAGVWFCLHHLRSRAASRSNRTAWTVFLVLLPPIGIFWFYVRELRRLVGGTEYLRESLFGRILFMRIGGKKR